MRAHMMMGVVSLMVNLIMIAYGALLMKRGGFLFMMFTDKDGSYLGLLLNITPILLLNLNP